ncbi:SAM hydrolase/SAM-dependent halogenase family protein [Halorussus amylolyticus]|uniref:SAM hydrolase/SAM-dependent halogenase family protein n=1 Tax=Halorussus amylolyticus TaxID=1126242 RepID=UPI001047EEC5|nr:SAM-dependent chlorinase/fluorinase [Halorussus amylolyticus]
MITLASDFGTPYPAAMKGVILQRTDARLVDVAHDFPRQDVRTAAFWLREVLPYFPPAVHLVVVDPGVGTDRAALAVRAGDHALVGPDNGVLLPAARALASPADAGDASATDTSATDAEIEVFEVEYEDAETASTTFHGRDVFAPAAADVHEAGVESLEELDRVVPRQDFADLRFPAPDLDAETEENSAIGEVLVVDGFGNVVTNLPGDLLAGREQVAVNGERSPVARAYAAVEPGDRLVTVGSHGNVELAVNRGRGDEAFGLSVGDEVRVTW